MPKARDLALLESLPPHLKAARARVGITQEQLADRAGVDRTIVSRVEAGQRLPSLGVFCALAYGVDEKPELLLARVLHGQSMNRT